MSLSNRHRRWPKIVKPKPSIRFWFSLPVFASGVTERFLFRFDNFSPALGRERQEREGERGRRGEGEGDAGPRVELGLTLRLLMGELGKGWPTMSK